MANAILAQVQSISLDNSGREHPSLVSHSDCIVVACKEKNQKKNSTYSINTHLQESYPGIAGGILQARVLLIAFQKRHSQHPTAGRRCRVKGPSSAQVPWPRLEQASDTECDHSEDSAGEKEAKRQRSEPTTPVSTSSRRPYEYDAIMGITRVGTRESGRV